jgi:hypothetical protein
MLPFCLRRAGEGWTVPIRPIIQNEFGAPFSPEDVAALTTAFEAALAKLQLVDRTDPMTTAVAKVITQLAKDDERDPKKLCDDALAILRK